MLRTLTGQEASPDSSLQVRAFAGYLGKRRLACAHGQGCCFVVRNPELQLAAVSIGTARGGLLLPSSFVAAVEDSAVLRSVTAYLCCRFLCPLEFMAQEWAAEGYVAAAGHIPGDWTPDCLASADPQGSLDILGSGLRLGYVKSGDKSCSGP